MANIVTQKLLTTSNYCNTVIPWAEAKHVESVPVTETHQGKTVWYGVVEGFGLIGHPKTHRVYAWAHETDPANFAM
jgi:hypothetical protein